MTALATLGVLVPVPRAVIDTDPENMREPDQTDRAFFAHVKEAFGIYDLIVAGVRDPNGSVRVDTLQRLVRIADGIVAIDGVIVEDVLSRSTTDNVTSDSGLVEVARIMETPPNTAEEVAAIHEVDIPFSSNSSRRKPGRLTKSVPCRGKNSPSTNSSRRGQRCENFRPAHGSGAKFSRPRRKITRDRDRDACAKKSVLALHAGLHLWADRTSTRLARSRRYEGARKMQMKIAGPVSVRRDPAA